MHAQNPTRILLLALVLLWTGALQASVPFTDFLTAADACPAFASKNKQTNPGGVHLVPGEGYRVREANRIPSPDWYRVLVPGAEPEERWVAASCGRLAGGRSGPAPARQPAAEDRPPCSTPGLADSYVLALSWQPAFCESRSYKAECRVDDPRAYEAGNFTLHGLWPNRAECGIDYGFCGEVAGKAEDFCDYPPVILDPWIAADLAQVMPSFRAGTCLERHEWHKHGTCQTRWTDDEYYRLAVDLARQFNDAGMGGFMSQRLGETVTTAELLSRVDNALGPGTGARVQLDCASGMLMEVRITLPADLAPGESLGSLMGRARAGFRPGDCGLQFRVDRMGSGR